MNTFIRKKRSVRAYHYDMVQICRETDRVYTRCRVCGERKPSDLNNFAKETHSNKKREIQPICRECFRKQQREYAVKNTEPEQFLKIEAPHLFNEEKQETIETKLDKVISFFRKLGLE